MDRVIAFFAGVAVAVLGGIGYLTLEKNQGSLETVVVQRLIERPPEPQVSTAEKNDPPPPSPPPSPPRPTVEVSSIHPSAFHPVAGWAVKEERMGYIDNFAVVKVDADPGNGGPTVPVDLVEVSGWAGHTALGMRFSHVLFSVCGMIVGSAPIDGNRPDVAETIHPNLQLSGWRGRIHTGSLPRCRRPFLEAWGLAAVGTYIWPLNGSLAIVFPDTEAPPPPVIAFRKTPLSPEHRLQPTSVAITVLLKRVNLRRCGSTKCKIVGKIKGGEVSAFIVEKSQGWSLLEMKDQSGWMADRLFKVSQATP